LLPDITFLGFNFSKTEALGDPGYYFIIEERISEARFGMDSSKYKISSNPENWDELAWGHIEGLDLNSDAYMDGKNPKAPTNINNNEKNWDNSADTSSASIAWITLQKPVRVAIHASQLLPKIDNNDDDL
jgi:hypothetical protein